MWRPKRRSSAHRTTVTAHARASARRVSAAASTGRGLARSQRSSSFTSRRSGSPRSAGSVRAQPSHSGQPARVGSRQYGQMRVATETSVRPMLRALPPFREPSVWAIVPGCTRIPSSGWSRCGGSASSSAPSSRCCGATRERQAAAGTATAASDERLAALERELAELDAAVEGLRARLGRPHR